jgi:hypothetical protein
MTQKIRPPFADPAKRNTLPAKVVSGYRPIVYARQGLMLGELLPASLEER